MAFGKEQPVGAKGDMTIAQLLGSAASATVSPLPALAVVFLAMAGMVLRNKPPIYPLVAAFTLAAIICFVLAIT